MFVNRPHRQRSTASKRKSSRQYNEREKDMGLPTVTWNDSGGARMIMEYIETMNERIKNRNTTTDNGVIPQAVP
jgi:hypothetical protein